MESFESVGIVGLGQIGASLAYGLSRNLDLIGYDVDPTATKSAKAAGIRIGDTVEDLLSQVDLCFFAIPAAALKAMLGPILAGQWQRSVLLVDLCSTKLDIEEAILSLGPIAGEIRYVGLHPLAGNERRGSAGAEADMFRSKTIVVSTGRATDAMASVSIASLLSVNLGARLLFVNPALHDRVTNFTIQLPHIFAYLTSSFANSVRDQGLLKILSGNSFADVTRVANSSPEMVASFLFANREIVARSLGQLETKLSDLLEALGSSDESHLSRLLASYAPVKFDAIQSEFFHSYPVRTSLDYRKMVLQLELERVLVDTIVQQGASVEVSGTRSVSSERSF